jgi:hypothetical protein
MGVDGADSVFAGIELGLITGLDFDQNATLEFLGRWKNEAVCHQRLEYELFLECVLHDLDHCQLLFGIAVHLERKDKGEVAADEGVSVDDSDAIREQDTSSQGSSVRDNWASIRAIPAVNLYTTTSLLKGTNISLSARSTGHLATEKISVVRARDEVLVQRPVEP